MNLIEEIQSLEQKVIYISKERDELENEIYKGIFPLQKELRTITGNYNALQIKHSNLQIKSADKLMRKKKKCSSSKISNNSRKRMRVIRKKIQKLNLKCVNINNQLIEVKSKEDGSNKDCCRNYNDVESEMTRQTVERLTQQNTLFMNELDQRNVMIEHLQKENEKILRLVQDYENDLNKKIKMIDTVKFIEKQVLQIKNIIDTEEQKKISGKFDNTIREIDVTPLLKAPSTNGSETVYIFSDRYGLGLGDKLATQSLGKKVVNFCSPGSSLRRLVTNLSKSAKKCSCKSVHVLVVGEKLDVSRDEFKECILLLKEISTRNKIIICTLPYGSHNKDNNYLYQLNLDLYNLTCCNSSNIHLIDINNIIDANKFNSLNAIKNTLCKILLWNIDAPIGKKPSTVIEIITQSSEVGNVIITAEVNESQIIKPSDFLGLELTNNAFQ